MHTANPSDPLGLIGRAPVLGELALQDRKLADALSRGDAFAVYEALRGRQKALRAGSDDWLKVTRLLADRRLFVRSAKPPSLFRLNTIGTALFFEHEKSTDDGSFIGTQCFSAFFAPVAPLGQYLMQHAPGGGWYFHGEVPFSDGMRLWRRMVAGFFAICLAGLVVVAGAGAIGGSGLAGGSLSYFGPSTQTIHVVNGLDVPFRVEVDGAVAADGGGDGIRELFVGPGERPTVDVQLGARTLRAFSVEGELVDQVALDVSSPADFAAFNILGAAPLYAEGIRYGSFPNLLPNNEVVEYAGTSSVSRAQVPYVFRKAPETIKLGKYESSRVVWTISLDEGGWKQSARNLRFIGKRKEAGALVGKIVLLDSAAVYEAWTAAADIAAGGGLPAALEFARKADAAYPDDSYVGELLLTYLQGNGLEEEAQRVFAERATQKPEDWRLTWLAARTEPVEVAVKSYEKLLREHPDQPLLARSFAGLMRRMGYHARAVELHGRARVLGSPDRPNELADQLRSLVAMGKTSQALEFADEHGEALEVIDFSFAVDFARLITLAEEPAEDATLYFDEYLAASKTPESDKAVFYALTQLAPVTPEMLSAITHAPTREAASLTAEAVSDLEKATVRGRIATSDVIARMDIEAVVLLGCEFVRRGEKAVAARYFGNDAFAARAQPALEAFIGGGKTLSVWNNLRPEFRAAAMLARARSLPGGRDRDLLLAQLKEEDVLRGPVALAAEAWQSGIAFAQDVP